MEEYPHEPVVYLLVIVQHVVYKYYASCRLPPDPDMVVVLTHALAAFSPPQTLADISSHALAASSASPHSPQQAGGRGGERGGILNHYPQATLIFFHSSFHSSLMVVVVHTHETFWIAACCQAASFHRLVFLFL